MNEEEFHKRKTKPGIPEVKEKELLPPIPQNIGPYKIEAFLDKGGMSLLYLGVHPETEETTVVKVLSPKYLKRPEVVQRFLKEAEIISMTNHPNIIKLYGQGEWEEGLYIAMEFVEGISLRQYLLQTPISLKHALEFILEISYALCHLHTHGVIHRDLKPENILVTEEQGIKVIDFGIAQLLTEQISPEGKPKMRMIGTPIYISPEQRENPESVGFPSDIYSLGIIAYELILGKLSHGRLHLSLMPKGMQKILTKALQPDPQHRYQDIVDFITDISNYMHSSALEEDKKMEDQLSELSEDLRAAQLTLYPKKLPDWPEMDIAVDIRTGMSIAGLYYDFFHTHDRYYGVLLCESSAKGARAVTSISLIRGMVRSLYRLTNTPSEIAVILNELLYQEQLDPIFPLSILFLDPKDEKFIYLSTGNSKLWRLHDEEINPIKSDNLALGVDLEHTFTDVTGEWSSGDILLLPTYATISSEAGFDEKAFTQTVLENAGNTPQKLVENILRKRHPITKRPLQERPIALIAIQKK